MDGGLWAKKGGPEKSVLSMILRSSNVPDSEKLYYSFFNNYRKDVLSSIFSAEVHELSGGVWAEWECELYCEGWDTHRVDSAITKIVKWHTDEIDRIKALELRDACKKQSQGTMCFPDEHA